MRHVILFGGSFDPIHNGHLDVAKAALKQRQADELWFIPTKVSPFKSGGTSFEHRQAMIELMISPFRKLKICDIENHLPSPSYSIDTVLALKKQYPTIQFDWLIGSDQLARMHEWKNYDQLKDEVQFVVYKRTEIVENHEYPQIQGPVIEVSSTEIRNGMSTNTSPRVLNYMMTQGLYLDSILKNRVSEFRYEHVLRVTECALEISNNHRMNQSEVFLAAMMHDLAKDDDKDKLKHSVQANFSKQIDLHPAFYHAFAASSELSQRYYVRNKHVLKAIQGHVNGKSTTQLGMLLYIADKCERGRGYDSEPFIELAKKDIRKGFLAVKDSQESYLNRRNHE